MPKTYVCQRCDHSWQTRIDHLPVRCPKCQSTSWHKPRTGVTGPTVKEELLEACKALLADMPDTDTQPDTHAIEIAKAAIARAEGE